MDRDGWYEGRREMKNGMRRMSMFPNGRWPQPAHTRRMGDTWAGILCICMLGAHAPRSSSVELDAMSRHGGKAEM